MYRERPLLGFVQISRELKNVRDIFLYIRGAKKILRTARIFLLLYNFSFLYILKLWQTAI